MKIKSCVKCGAKDRDVRGDCKACSKTRNKKHWADNSDYNKRARDKWNADNPDYYKQYRADNLEYLRVQHKDYYGDNRKEIEQYQKQYQNDNSKSLRKKAKQYRNDNPEKLIAQGSIRGAIRSGALLPASTLICNRCDNQAMDYHHGSYEPEHRLDVEPLCRSCHKLEHSEAT